MPKARAPTSRQLRLLLDCLGDGREHSAWDLCMHARTSDPTTGLRELRSHGYEIPKRYVGGKHVYYRLTNADLNRYIAQQRAELETRMAELSARNQPPTQTHPEESFA